ncbi:MAG TPA: GNAT family N-acetyltransferase [Gaiellaceae bacterium]|nr:GNAT family N-acetyltransferase [Gaiellaceae bacterium]
MSVRLEPWGEDDLPLLRRLLGDPAMTTHLGGPESEQKLVERQARYEKLDASGAGQMFKIVDEAGEAVGSVGYWEKEWRDGTVYETGWSVLPEHQGRGLAVAGTRLVIDETQRQRRHRYLHAFPGVENEPSNAICRKLGFELLETLDFEYPPGNSMRCNDWRLDLFADG